MSWRWLSIAVAAVVGGATPAHASAEVVELRYAAPASCPTLGAIESAILERTANVRFGAPARRVFVITIQETADGFRGTLEIDERSEAAGGGDPAGSAGGAGGSAPRGIDTAADKELAAQRCEDLANAFALVTALAIDPTASILPRPRTEPPPSLPAAAVEADLDAMIDAGVGPAAMFAAVVEARVPWRGDYRLELAAIAGRDTKGVDGGEARFTWLAVRPAACRRWTWPAIAPGMEIVWLAIGAHGRVGLPLYQNIFAQLQLGASVPLVRDRYLFAPNVAIHETPLVTGWLVLGIGLQFR
ncbi:MAG: hypothetical protein E6J91_22065 [Deltaproteobacteria bacterium]|nr:MAG: hypothetical protein E6J91_22065 [Deltaproteobacteria bacterium]